MNGVPSTPSTPRPRAPRTATDMRCRTCDRLLAKMDPGGLKPGAKLEIKCGRCNEFNVRIGDDVRRPAH